MVERWGSEAEAAGPGNSFLLFFYLIIILMKIIIKIIKYSNENKY